METEIYESDPFTAKKEGHLVTIDTDYRFQKGDELYLHQGGGRQIKVRIIDVRLHVEENGRVSRELLALKV